MAIHIFKMRLNMHSIRIQFMHKHTCFHAHSEDTHSCPAGNSSMHTLLLTVTGMSLGTHAGTPHLSFQSIRVSPITNAMGR